MPHNKQARAIQRSKRAKQACEAARSAGAQRNELRTLRRALARALAAKHKQKRKHLRYIRLNARRIRDQQTQSQRSCRSFPKLATWNTRGTKCIVSYIA